MTTPDTRPRDDADAAAAPLTYSFKPRAFGTEVTFRITPTALEWSSDHGGDRITFAKIARVRASFEPRQMLTNRWKLEIWPKTGPKVWFASVSAMTLIEAKRHDASYRAFVLELHRRLQDLDSQAVFVGGRSPVIWLLGVVFALSSLTIMVFLAARAVWGGELAMTILMGGMVCYFGYEMGRWFLFNWPRRYRPDAIPPNLLPPA